jgi:hypothetical protein
LIFLTPQPVRAEATRSMNGVFTQSVVLDDNATFGDCERISCGRENGQVFGLQKQIRPSLLLRASLDYVCSSKIVLPALRKEIPYGQSTKNH